MGKKRAIHDCVISASHTRNQPTSERGAALLAALCFAMVMAVALASYITVCYRSLQLSTRNLNSTHGAELAELGMEEALWTLNKNDWSNGWTFTGTTATKTLTGFTYDNGATGAVRLTVTNYGSTTHTLTAIGTITLADGTTQSRTLTSTSTPAPLFVNAVAGTTGLVKFTTAGTSSNIDSYDRSLGLYSAQTPTYSAILSSGSTSTAASTVQLTNAQVNGYVATLSTGPSYSTSAKLVGSAAQPAVANRAPTNAWVDLTRMTSSPYQPIFGIKTPTGTGTTLNNPSLNSTTTLGTAGATTPSIYYCSGLDLTGNTQLIIDGPVQLVMTGTAAFYVGLHYAPNTAGIQITTNGSLEVFSGGDIAIYGNGISNLNKDAKKCVIYGSNALTVPDMNTTQAFHGVIYTPSGDFQVWSNNAIYGAIVARNVTFSGAAPVVHYDLSLRSVVLPGIDTPFAVSSVRDTTNP